MSPATDAFQTVTAGSSQQEALRNAKRQMEDEAQDDYHFDSHSTSPMDTPASSAVGTKHGSPCGGTASIVLSANYDSTRRRDPSGAVEWNKWEPLLRKADAMVKSLREVQEGFGTDNTDKVDSDGHNSRPRFSQTPSSKSTRREINKKMQALKLLGNEQLTKSQENHDLRMKALEGLSGGTLDNGEREYIAFQRASSELDLASNYFICQQFGRQAQTVKALACGCEAYKSYESKKAEETQQEALAYLTDASRHRAAARKAASQLKDYQTLGISSSCPDMTVEEFRNAKPGMPLTPLQAKERWHDQGKPDFPTDESGFPRSSTDEWTFNALRKPDDGSGRTTYVPSAQYKRWESALCPPDEPTFSHAPWINTHIPKSGTECTEGEGEVLNSILDIPFQPTISRDDSHNQSLTIAKYLEQLDEMANKALNAYRDDLHAQVRNSREPYHLTAETWNALLDSADAERTSRDCLDEVERVTAELWNQWGTQQNHGLEQARERIKDTLELQNADDATKKLGEQWISTASQVSELLYNRSSRDALTNLLGRHTDELDILNFEQAETERELLANVIKRDGKRVVRDTKKLSTAFASCGIEPLPITMDQLLDSLGSSVKTDPPATSAEAESAQNSDILDDYQHDTTQDTSPVRLPRLRRAWSADTQLNSHDYPEHFTKGTITPSFLRSRRSDERLKHLYQWRLEEEDSSDDGY